METPVTPNTLVELLEHGRKYKLAKGHIIQSSDTRQVVNLIKAGYVKRYMIANDGTIRIQSVYGPDDVFPLTVVFKTLFNQSVYEGSETYHYETMTDAELCTIDPDTLVDKAKDNPMIYRDLLLQSGKRFHSNIQQLENLSLKTSYHRVAHQLLYFAKKFGTKNKEGVRIELPLSHQTLGDMLSITRETVTNSMKELRGKGLVKTGKFITVTNLDKLQEEAYS